jgi:hypothetical protein
MNDPRQLELFSDGVRAVAAGPRRRPAQPTEAELQAKLNAARTRLHEIVILGMKTWLPPDTLKGLRQAEAWRRGEVRLQFRVLERFREEQRRRTGGATAPRRGEVDATARARYAEIGTCSMRCHH